MWLVRARARRSAPHAQLSVLVFNPKKLPLRACALDLALRAGLGAQCFAFA